MKEIDCRVPLAALAGLLECFRQGRIVDTDAERAGINECTAELTAQWDGAFPGFPDQYFPYTSFRGEQRRSKRDEYLKSIIVRKLQDNGSTKTTIVNPACVFGRHACDLASRMPKSRVIGTDIYPPYYRAYRLAKAFHLPDNYSFVKDNIFSPQLDVAPTAVVFFGACGSVTDGAIDYGIGSRAKYLMFRTCCHDNIGGNITVVKRPNAVNLFFRLKNWGYGRMRHQEKYAEFYFSEKYPSDAYPRSKLAKDLSTSDEFQAIAANSADSDICRAIIDLDRYIYLVEHGFKVLYQAELFVAERES
jgi:hypothetical protein